MNRENRTERIVSKLNQAVSIIRSFEGQGEKDLAMKMASELEKVMGQMQAWSSLIDLLDEKDVHGWLWLRCRSGSASYCSIEQLDVALANLWVRKEFIPEDQLRLIEEDGKKLLQRKKD
ncbi:hypothetical protein GW915_07660 [bacterium]|nr:hypothetical protein [bacterium]